MSKKTANCLKIISLILISIMVLFCVSACSNDTRKTELNNNEYNIKADEKINVEGIVEKTNSAFPQYCLKLDKSITIHISNQFDTEEYTCAELYFYDDSEINGNYDYDSVIGQRCVITAQVENYRGAGQMFLLKPQVKCNNKEIAQKQFVTIPDWYTKKIYVCNETKRNFYIKDSENNSAELYIDWKHIGTIYLNEATSGNDDTGIFYRYICHIDDTKEIRFLYYSSTDRIIVYDENSNLSGAYEYLRTME